jgi:hypothetical protein
MMSFNILHQVGHFPSWNIDSFIQDKCGDGLILSPVHQARNSVEKMSEEVKRRSLFDPQYYLPNSQKSKLSTYDFFPEVISNGFSTSDFPLVALKSAQMCVEFQLAQQFSGIVIPARFVEQLTPRYFEKQEEYTIVPFLKVLSNLGVSKPIYLTLPLTAAMLQDEESHRQLLNWVTGFPEISGVYLLVHDDRPSKQIRSRELLSGYLDFVHLLTGADLSVIAGHLNTESLLFTCMSNVSVTFGSFENTRMFSMDKFLESDEERRAPKPRIYLPPLMNWIQYDQALQIRNEAPDLWDRIYIPTKYADEVLNADVDPYFNQPGLYKHHFLCLQRQVRSFADLQPREAYYALRAALKAAIALYQDLEESAFDLDNHGSGAHLQAWLDSLNGFYRRHLKT